MKDVAIVMGIIVVSCIIYFIWNKARSRRSVVTEIKDLINTKKFK